LADSSPRGLALMLFQTKNMQQYNDAKVHEGTGFKPEKKNFTESE